MSIRYITVEAGEAGIPKYRLRCDGAADVPNLPTPTKLGKVFDENHVEHDTYAAVGSVVASDNLTIIQELQSDALWHPIGGAV